MTPQPNVHRAEEAVEQERTQPMPQVVDPETMRLARRRWVVDNWILAAMIVCIGLFAGAMALYVFVPAARTLVGN